MVNSCIPGVCAAVSACIHSPSLHHDVWKREGRLSTCSNDIISQTVFTFPENVPIVPRSFRAQFVGFFSFNPDRGCHRKYTAIIAAKGDSTPPAYHPTINIMLPPLLASGGPILQGLLWKTNRFDHGWVGSPPNILTYVGRRVRKKRLLLL